MFGIGIIELLVIAVMFALVVGGVMTAFIFGTAKGRRDRE